MTTGQIVAAKCFGCITKLLMANLPPRAFTPPTKSCICDPAPAMFADRRRPQTERRQRRDPAAQGRILRPDLQSGLRVLESAVQVTQATKSKMELITTVVQILNVISALAVIVLVLLQHGKGADMGAAFGSGSAGSLFGSAGSANFLSRATAFCATIFFATCLALVLITAPAQKKSELGVMGSEAPATTQPAQPDQKKIPD